MAITGETDSSAGTGNDTAKVVQSADLTIEVFGEQFQWHVRYPGDDGQLGKSSYRLVDSLNKVGIDYNDSLSADDFLAQDQIHLPAQARIHVVFRSKDVIHAAYFPHFNAQMNVVPGLQTELYLETGLTTGEQREVMNDPAFNYKLLCNKICGERHYQMTKEILVEDPAEFISWYKQQSGIARQP